MKIYYTFFTQHHRAREFSRALLEKVLLEHGFHINNLTPCTGAHGRPEYKELPFDFNLSHTNGMAAVCIGKKVGVDCELIRNLNQQVIFRVCSEEEINKIYSAQSPSTEFIMCWTLKEAFSKMLGSGFRYSFKGINTGTIYSLYPRAKIFQTKLEGFVLTAIEETGGEILMQKVDLLS